MKMILPLATLRSIAATLITAALAACGGGGGGANDLQSAPTTGYAGAQTNFQASLSGRDSANNALSLQLGVVPNAGTTTFAGAPANSATQTLTLSRNGAVLTTQIVTQYYQSNPYVSLGSVNVSTGTVILGVTSVVPPSTVLQQDTTGVAHPVALLSSYVPNSFAPITSRIQKARNEVPIDQRRHLRSDDQFAIIGWHAPRAKHVEPNEWTRKEFKLELESILDEIALDVFAARGPSNLN